MANSNAPFGFQPFFPTQGGATPSFGLEKRKILNTYATKLHRGTPVVTLNTGYINVLAPGTVQMAGIFWGCSYYSTAAKRWVWSPYWPAGTPSAADAFAEIITDPNILFVCQSTGASAAIAFADIGANAQCTIGSGNDATGMSGSTLNDAGITTTDTLPFRIVDLLSSYAPPGTDGTDDASIYNRVIVRANYTDRTSRLGI